jgi:LytS/YehU family sensor histidine kinase
MLDHMIAYLRATLDASRATTHPLGSEFDRLRDYLELMAIRMGPRLTFTLELPPELAGLPVPTLLLQPLVENSIQHGLEPKVQGGRIHVRARSAEGQLVIEVEDSGVGAEGSTKKGAGFGLSQIRERLAALYGAAASLDFATSPAGAHARISLPIA